MIPLVVVRREGLLLVSGIIEDFSNVHVTIKGPMMFETRGSVDLKMRISFDESSFERMPFTKGSRVFATTTDSFICEMIMDGAEMDENTIIDVEAFNIRYSGSFDFDDRSSVDREIKCFCGKVQLVHKFQDAAGIVVGFTRKQRKEVRNVYLDQSLCHLADKLDGKTVAVITDTAKPTKAGEEVYPAFKIFF